MIKALRFFAYAAVGVISVTSTDYQEPPQILANPVTEWTGSYEKSRVGKISSKFVNADGEEGEPASFSRLSDLPHPFASQIVSTSIVLIWLAAPMSADLPLAPSWLMKLFNLLMLD
jgi:hypothetical protein